MAIAIYTVKERLLKLIDKNHDCWEWKGSVGNHGYGRLTTGSRTNGTRRTQAAHRVAYEVFTGEKIPQGLTIDHLCRNKVCINPEHLEVVTLQENCRRRSEANKATHCKYGHEFKKGNLYEYNTKRGYVRNCKTCMKDYTKRRYAERRLSSLAH